MTTTPKQSEPYWLIERGSPCEWWVCGTGSGKRDGKMIYEEWTRDASKALRFNDEYGAKHHARELEQWGVKGPLRATEHLDIGMESESTESTVPADKSGARLTLWTAMREYIAAEINLGMIRASVLHASAHDRGALEAQVTRMETEVRRLLEAL